MPSDKRQRQDEGRYGRRVAEMSAAKKDQRRKQIRNIGILLVVLVVVGLVLSLRGAGDDEDVATGSTTTTLADEGTVEVVYPGTGAVLTAETPCPPADGSAERTTGFTAAPPTCIDPAKTYRATIATSEGQIVVDLDAAKAPIAVNNFVVLARYHYYDDVPFHRIVPGFVDQAGTPVDQASPEIETTPGYVIPDELPDTTALASPAEAYPDGALAMANRGPDTGSSQFFIVVGGGGQQFASNPNYTVFGQVVEGLEVAEAINQHGDAATNGTPTKLITITSVTITEQ
ncbi:MAG TPA: peptidylprolyl isomerase [Acidimicrobiales bacterium]|nr:peptidylprolyl isomerase [Acidimicrobiales bacterium]